MLAGSASRHPIRRNEGRIVSARRCTDSGDASEEGEQQYRIGGVASSRDRSESTIRLGDQA